MSQITPKQPHSHRINSAHDLQFCVANKLQKHKKQNHENIKNN